jgi:hypothetical protein
MKFLTFVALAACAVAGASGEFLSSGVSVSPGYPRKKEAFRTLESPRLPRALPPPLAPSHAA